VCQLTEIDVLARLDHSWLTPADRCFFLGEYSARKGFAFSPMNQTILNFKKSVDRKGFPEWRHKERAIQEVAQMFGHAAGHWLSRATLVPTPPSRAKDDRLYDDRMARLLRAIQNPFRLDIRELVIQNNSITAAHDTDARPTPCDLVKHYKVAENLIAPVPDNIIVFDDVLTTGAHYVAMRQVLSARFPLAEILGFFVARRVP